MPMHGASAVRFVISGVIPQPLAGLAIRGLSGDVCIPVRGHCLPVFGGMGGAAAVWGTCPLPAAQQVSPWRARTIPGPGRPSGGCRLPPPRKGGRKQRRGCIPPTVSHVGGMGEAVARWSRPSGTVLRLRSGGMGGGGSLGWLNRDSRVCVAGPHNECTIGLCRSAQHVSEGPLGMWRGVDGRRPGGTSLQSGLWGPTRAAFHGSPSAVVREDVNMAPLDRRGPLPHHVSAPLHRANIRREEGGGAGGSREPGEAHLRLRWGWGVRGQKTRVCTSNRPPTSGPVDGLHFFF